jgi:hypothetical protein
MGSTVSETYYPRHASVTIDDVYESMRVACECNNHKGRPCTMKAYVLVRRGGSELWVCGDCTLPRDRYLRNYSGYIYDNAAEP